MFGNGCGSLGKATDGLDIAKIVINPDDVAPEIGIDVHHLAMTGCSRWGKGTLAVGAFDALGVSDNYTYSQEGGHDHCALPNGQFDEVQDFINKFLLGKDAKTGKIDYSKNTEPINWKKTDWIDWETPTLN